MPPGCATSCPRGTFTGPDDAPFVCGLVLFTAARTTGTTTGPTTGLVGLSEQQPRRVVDAHAAASTDDPTDLAGPVDGADAQLALA